MSDALERAIVARVQRGDVRIPAYPPSAGKLAKVLGKPGFSMQEVVQVLRTDDVLAATTLRLANSAFYRRTEAATTLSSAVVRIGSHQLHRLSVAAGTQRVFAAPGPLQVLRRRALRQALMGAVICERLAALSGDSTEEAFVGGLLHDIGRVLAIAVVEELGGGEDVEDAWRLVERFHVELGMVIAARWMLPAQIEEVIADHHVRDATMDEPFLRRIQASDQVVALLEQEPSVTAERLGSIGLLTTKECKALAAEIPHMPEFIEAFGINQGAESPTHAPAAAPLIAVAAAGVPVELHACGPMPVKGELKDGCSTALTIHATTPGRANWLVQVKVQGLSFWANVRESTAIVGGGYAWDLKPFALSADVAEKWGAVTAGLARAA